MLVSVIVGLLNEEKYLPSLLEDFENQTYNKQNIELVFIDGMSTDKSWQILEDFKNHDKEFNNILLLKNPKRILSAAMNIGIKAAKGEVFLKVDCHSHIENNFIEENVKLITSGQDVCGGPRPNIIESQDDFSKTLLLVEENMFGSGFASYRKKSGDNKIKYVSSVFQGMYKREVLEKVGLLDEEVGRVEDNELHYRIRKAGYKIAYSNNIQSYQYTRPNLKGMLRQKYLNGYWIGKVSHIYPKAFSIFHFVPFVFLLALLISTLFMIVSPVLIGILLAVYCAFLVLISVVTIMNNGFSLSKLLLPFLIFMVHISYGAGTLVGLIKGFSWKKTYKGDLERL